MDTIIGLFLFAVAVFAVAVIGVVINVGAKKRDLEVVLRGIVGFAPDEFLVSAVGGIALDMKARKIALARVNDGRTEAYALPFSAITGVELDVFRESSTVKTKKTGFVSFESNSAPTSIELTITLTTGRYTDFRVPVGTMGQANEWKGKLLGVMRAGARSDGNRDVRAHEGAALADAIGELFRLRQAGALTEDEFRAAKAQALEKTAAGECAASPNKT